MQGIGKGGAGESVRSVQTPAKPCPNKVAMGSLIALLCQIQGLSAGAGAGGRKGRLGGGKDVSACQWK